MEPATLTKILADYGPWGLLALALLALRWLFLRYDAAQEARIADGQANGALASRAVAALNKTNLLIEESSARVKASLLRLERAGLIKPFASDDEGQS